MASIRTPGSIWAKLIEQSAANAKKPDGRGDAFVYFVGSRASGKSTLLNRFLYPYRTEVPKPSEGLEYTYARKPSNYDHEKKDLAHIWEVGGSSEFAEEIVHGEQIFLNAKQVTTSVVVIVVDLSDPCSVMETTQYWLDMVKKKLGTTYDRFEKKGLQLPQQLRQRATSKLYSQNEDKDVVYQSGVAIVIAATKYDTFKDFEPEVKKVMSRALRFLAHTHGAFLTYLSGLHSGSDATGQQAADDKALMDNFTRLMNHLIFTGLEKKPLLKMSPQTDHQGGIMMPAGADKLRDIGRPRGVADQNIAQGLQEWKELYGKMFPPKDKEKTKTKFQVDERYKEEEIDAVRDRKMAELEQYRKEQEAAKEAAKKRAVMAKAQELAKKQAAHGDRASAKKKPSSGKPKPVAPPAAAE